MGCPFFRSLGNPDSLGTQPLGSQGGKDTLCGKKSASSSRFPSCGRRSSLHSLLLAVYRVGSHIPLIVFSHEKLAKLFNPEGGGGGGGVNDVLQNMSVFSGTNLGQATIFGLGIMPYISASIISQLLASVYPPLEKLQKEGETGRKKINEYTRYATVFLCLGQSWFYVVWLSPQAEI